MAMYCGTNPAENSPLTESPGGPLDRRLGNTTDVVCGRGYYLTAGSLQVTCEVLNSTVGKWNMASATCSSLKF